MEDIKDNNQSTGVPNIKDGITPSKDVTSPADIKKLADEKKLQATTDKKLLIEKRNAERKQKLEEQKKKLEEKKKEQAKKRIRPILRYYNSELLIPVDRSKIIPGNCYVFKYPKWKHVEIPLTFYIGTNPQYNTFEGISLQYLSVNERKRLFAFFRKTELHSKHMSATGLLIRNLQGENRHIFRRNYTSDSIYHYMKKKMQQDILFYRRYKFNAITGKIYVVPIEALDRAVEINTPVKPVDRKKLEESKRLFGSIINKMQRK
jgi:hypothetical protein